MDKTLKTNMLPFKGMLCINIPMNNGFNISLLNWESTPTKYNAFSQIWIENEEHRKTCYIDPGEAREIFNIYHHFDEVIPAKLYWNWNNNNELEITIENKNIKINITVYQTIIERLINIVLKTYLKVIFKHLGKTETNMSFCHQPHKIKSIKSAAIDLGGNETATLKADGRCLMSWCTHYLESHKTKAYEGAAPGC